MLKNTDWAYIAGIIDGEGCIGIRKNVPELGRFKAVVTVANSNKLLIDYLYSLFGGSCNEYQDKRKYKSGRYRKPVWFWRIGDKQAELFLRQVYPYLLIKKPNADLIFKLRETFGTYRGSHNGVPSNIIELRQQYSDEMQELNRKGIAAR